MVRRIWKYLLPLFLLPIFLYPVTMLEVRAEKSDRVLLDSLARPGDRFEFSYIHSVEGIPVTGIFSLTAAGTLRAVETRFPSFGPGLPFLSGEVTREHGTLRASTEGLEMARFSFLVSPFTHQILSFGDRTVPCASLNEGELVTVKVARYPLWRVLIRHGR